MELYVLRHGIAADIGPAGTGDAGRPLTEQGIANMRAQGRGLARLGLTLDALYHSPLVRTQQTAAIIGEALGIEPQVAQQLAPGCDLARLRNLLEKRRSGERIMIVGHQPDCGEITSELTGGSLVEFKKGSLARIDLPAIVANAGVLIWLLSPRILRTIGQEQ